MTTAVRTDSAFRAPTTGEELHLLPEGMHGEIAEGVFVPISGGSGPHGSVIARIIVALGSVVYARTLGEVFGTETTFRLKRGPETTRCPDVAFVRAARIPNGVPRGVYEAAPDLAAEVLSPSNTSAEIARKRDDYLRYGARQVWIADPETRTVVVHAPGAEPRTLAGADVLDGGELLPGFSTPIAAFFAGLAPAAPHA